MRNIFEIVDFKILEFNVNPVHCLNHKTTMK